VNKEAKQFRGKPLQYREQLDEIFDGTAADGRFAQDSDFPIDPEYRDELPTLPINPSRPPSAFDNAEGAEGAEFRPLGCKSKRVSWYQTAIRPIVSSMTLSNEESIVVSTE